MSSRSKSLDPKRLRHVSQLLSTPLNPHQQSQLLFSFVSLKQYINSIIDLTNGDSIRFKKSIVEKLKQYNSHFSDTQLEQAAEKLHNITNKITVPHNTQNQPPLSDNQKALILKLISEFITTISGESDQNTAPQLRPAWIKTLKELLLTYEALALKEEADEECDIKDILELDEEPGAKKVLGFFASLFMFFGEFFTDFVFGDAYSHTQEHKPVPTPRPTPRPLPKGHPDKYK